MQDKVLTCRDCGREFIFSVSEQEFFAQKGFTNEPSRCPDCRSARKAASGGGRGAPRGDREMYPATCSQCGKATQVPFQPRADKPVYCSDCYSAQRPPRTSGGGYGGGGRRSGGGGGGRSRW